MFHIVVACQTGGCEVCGNLRRCGGSERSPASNLINEQSCSTKPRTYLCRAAGTDGSGKASASFSHLVQGTAVLRTHERIRKRTTFGALQTVRSAQSSLAGIEPGSGPSAFSTEDALSRYAASAVVLTRRIPNVAMQKCSRAAEVTNTYLHFQAASPPALPILRRRHEAETLRPASASLCFGTAQQCVG